jgi:hypothetical protein
MDDAGKRELDADALFAELAVAFPDFVEAMYPGGARPDDEEGRVLAYPLLSDFGHWLGTLSGRRDSDRLRAAFALLEPLAACSDPDIWTLVELELVEDVCWPKRHKQAMGPALRRRVD